MPRTSAVLDLLPPWAARVSRMRIFSASSRVEPTGTRTSRSSPEERTLGGRSSRPTRPLPRHHDRALDRVAQLAHVARPGIGVEGLPRLGVEALELLAVLLGELAQEGHGEQGDVVAPLAQGRHVDVDDVEPVVEVLAEGSLADLLLEVAVGRGDDAHVDLDRLLAADALELALLEHAQDLDLHVLVDLADLVEEEGALVGELEAAALAGLGPGEGALLVAEELALEEALGEGGAVDLDEGPVAPGREVVDRVGDELLADARLAR